MYEESEKIDTFLYNCLKFSNNALGIFINAFKTNKTLFFGKN